MNGNDLTYSSEFYAQFLRDSYKIQDTKENSLSSRSLVAAFLIPITFSFIYGGVVLGLSLQDPNRGFSLETGSQQSDSMQIVDLQNQYTSSDQISAHVSVSDAAFSCGDLYLTIYDVSTGQRKAVKQGAFFDQCYGSSGTLPLQESFSEKINLPGEYLLEAQLFDENGDKFLTASQRFSVQ